MCVKKYVKKIKKKILKKITIIIIQYINTIYILPFCIWVEGLQESKGASGKREKKGKKQLQS